MAPSQRGKSASAYRLPGDLLVRQRKAPVVKQSLFSSSALAPRTRQHWAIQADAQRDSTADTAPHEPPSFSLPRAFTIENDFLAEQSSTKTRVQSSSRTHDALDKSSAPPRSLHDPPQTLLAIFASETLCARRQAGPIMSLFRSRRIALGLAAFWLLPSACALLYNETLDAWNINKNKGSYIVDCFVGADFCRGNSDQRVHDREGQQNLHCLTHELESASR